MDEARFRQSEQRLWDSVGLRPTERFLSLARVGTRVRVQEWGDGPPVLFVHGATNAGASWSGLVRDLDDFRCITLDRPGCGLSEPLPRRLPDLTALGAYTELVLVDVLDALGLDRVHLVATSYGGYYALRTAAAHPERVDKLYLLGWALGATAPPRSVRMGSVPAIGRLMRAMPQNERTVRALLKRIGLRGALESGRFSPLMLDWFTSLLRDTDTLRNELQSGPQFTVGRMDDRLLLPAELLGRVKAPVHLFWGEDDPMGDAAAAREFSALLPDAELELIPGAGHAPWIDEPERAASSARGFLAG